MECSSCQKEWEKKGKPGRQLEQLPEEITQDGNFAKKDLPVQLCPYCDGDACVLAMDAHQKRIASDSGA